MSALELPSIREIELETLLRQREKQLSDLSVSRRITPYLTIVDGLTLNVG
jgi:hypothetical protein